jgi:hypothetical protein
VAGRKSSRLCARRLDIYRENSINVAVLLPRDPEILVKRVLLLASFTVCPHNISIWIKMESSSEDPRYKTENQLYIFLTFPKNIYRHCHT